MWSQNAFGVLPAKCGDSIFQGINYSTIISCYELMGDDEEVELMNQINFQNVMHTAIDGTYVWATV
jgi:hypothetical protein